MNFIKATTSSFIIFLILFGTVQSEENALKGIKLGFGFDRGLGITGSMGQFNGFIGNDGVAVDYIFMKQKIEAELPLHWYIGGGGFGDWDGDWGARLPVGGVLGFAERFDAYAQIIPSFRVNHHSEFELEVGLGVRYQF